MDPGKIKLCSLCLTVLGNSDFKEMETITMEMMDIVLLRVNPTSMKQDALNCLSCLKSLRRLFIFKSMCLDVEESVSRYAFTKNTPKVNLKDVYWAQNVHTGETYPCQQQNVCRLCLSLCDINALNEIKDDGYLLDGLKKYYPELNLNTTDSISVCKSCLNNLIHHFYFATNCLNSGNTYSTMIVSNCEAQLRKDNFMEFVSKNANVHTSLFAKDNEVKLEENSPVCDTNECLLEENGISGVIKGINLNTELDDSFSLEPKERPKTDGNQQTLPKLRCDHCSFTTTRITSLDTHSYRHKDVVILSSPSNQSNPLDTQSSKEPTLTHLERKPFDDDQRTLNSSSKLKMYKCDKCPYEVKLKCSLVKHQLKHKLSANNTKPSRSFKCKECPFKTKHKMSLITHSLRHKAPSELTLFECAFCDFSSKLKGNLKLHEAKHKSKTFKCDKCTFKTRHKMSLRTHSLRHKAPSELTLFECAFCDFSSKLKGNLKLHEAKHKSKTFKCDKCTFKTRHKMSLRTHFLRHKALSELTLFECDFCDFSSKLKGNLKLHEAKHKNKAFKCDKCTFKTRHKMSLRMHSLRHKAPPKLKLFKCGFCDFSAKLQRNLTLHEDKHRDETYKCEKCKFNTKHRMSLRVHMMQHRKL